MLGDHHRAVRHLRELRDLGVAVSIDDFGSGFGALARLAHLPVDIVKIDGRFLDVDSPMASRLLHLMIQGAHTVGLVAVAQGVEQDKQLATLRALDCESVQGFHLSRPMPPDDVARYDDDTGRPLQRAVALNTGLGERNSCSAAAAGNGRE